MIAFLVPAPERTAEGAEEADDGAVGTDVAVESVGTTGVAEGGAIVAVKGARVAEAEEGADAVDEPPERFADNEVAVAFDVTAGFFDVTVLSVFF